MKLSIKQLHWIIKESIAQTQSLIQEDMMPRDHFGPGRVTLDTEFDLLVPFSGQLKPGDDIIGLVDCNTPIISAIVLKTNGDGVQTRYGITPTVRFTFRTEEDKQAFIEECSGL